jgi:hypothetical protein
MTRLALFALLLSGCFEFDLDLTGFFSCGGTGGVKSQYVFGYAQGLVFPTCQGTDAALAPDGALALLNVGPTSKKSPPYQGMRSADPSVVEILRVGGVTYLRSHAAGTATVELVDAQDQVVDSTTVRVADPDVIDIADAAPGALLMAGGPVSLTLVPLHAGAPLLGVAGGEASADPPLFVTASPEDSWRLFGAKIPPNGTPTYSPTTVEILAGGPGTAELSITMGTGSVKKSFSMIDVETPVDEVHADPPSLVTSVGIAGWVRISGTYGGAPVRGLSCRWSLPPGLRPPTDVPIEKLADPPGASYPIVGVQAGTWTARCWLPGPRSVDVVVTVKD